MLSCLGVPLQEFCTVPNADVMAGMVDLFTEEFSDHLLRKIKILDVPEHLLDLIELYVEHTAHGGGEFENTEYDDSRQCLTVTFVHAKGLRNIICH